MAKCDVPSCEGESAGSVDNSGTPLSLCEWHLYEFNHDLLGNLYIKMKWLISVDFRGIRHFYLRFLPVILNFTHFVEKCPTSKNSPEAVCEPILIIFDFLES